MMKNIYQILSIILASLLIGIIFNQTLDNPLPLFSRYQPQTNQVTGEDLSIYYSEIDAEALKAMQESNMSVLVDARIQDKYKAGHLPNAINLPIAEFNKIYPKVSSALSDEKAIIVYCNGFQCIDSSLLAKELSMKGHQNILVYKGGFEDWQNLQFPVIKEND